MSRVSAREESVDSKREKAYSECSQIVQRQLVAKEMQEGILKQASVTIPVESSRLE